ncbi:MAG: glycoside hydrolase [Armatimonadetes bacterium]|nr:glycoside hydrolase [Armatimonadota bacterium]
MPKWAVVLALLVPCLASAQSSLESDFKNPPNSGKLRAYWWWLNGNVTRASIQRDLEQMAAKGFGGALICDANGADQFGNGPVPHGPDFFSPEWRELYKFTLQEAHKLGLEMSLNIMSGWNLGGPMVPAKDAPKKLVFSSTTVDGNATTIKLQEPKHDPALYGEVAVVAYPVDPSAKPGTLRHFEEKALIKGLSFSAPDTSLLLDDGPDIPREAATRSSEVIDVSRDMDADGTLHWKKRPGHWQVFRIGYTLNDHCHVSTNSEGWYGYAIDPFDKGAFMRYWNTVVEPLIRDAGPLAGNTLKYLHTDSWEVEVANWTPTLREEFRRRRGYDMWPYLPVMLGQIVDSRTKSNRFLNDLRRTIGDLAIDNHYRLFRDNAHKHGLLIHPESGGPHAVPIDSLQCLGMDDAPMSEFWASSWTHRVKEEDRFFVKQPASAAHTYGHNLVLAEGFTTIGPHWQETLWDNLKPNFDEASCQGLNRLVWHAFVCSPDSTGLPGQQYFAGTHLNPKVTWWNQSQPFFAYLNRVQTMLQKGRFVADALVYYGNHVPNFAQLEKSDPAKVRPGYDYDVATEEVILNRVQVENGDLVLPDGMRYRLLVLPNRTTISLPVLKKVRELVIAGATVLGPKPTEATSLEDYPQRDAEVKKIADELWGAGPSVPVRTVGDGVVLSGLSGRDALLGRTAGPDFAFTSPDDLDINYVHRRDGDADIYFVANRSKTAGKAACSFRVTGKVPEFWDPMTGEVRDVPSWTDDTIHTTVPMEFNPCGSMFVVFRRPGRPDPKIGPLANYDRVTDLGFLDSGWGVAFDPKWGGPAHTAFEKLTDWSENPDPGIRYYSGTAVYTTTFEGPQTAIKGLALDLGSVHEVSEVILNGRNLGIVWAPPFRVDISQAVQPGTNVLEVRVTNFWPNRVIGDARSPGQTPFTRTNIRNLTADSKLMPSGLLGPVRIVSISRGK